MKPMRYFGCFLVVISLTFYFTATGISLISRENKVGCYPQSSNIIVSGQHSSSIEWLSRSQMSVTFMNDPNLVVRVYNNSFQGSTLWDLFWGLVSSNEWEPETFRVLKAVLKGHNNCSFVDFGAWIGPTALFASKFCPNVYAIEPDPLAFSALVANVNLNKEARERIKVYFGVITTEPGPVTMVGNGDSTSHIMSGKVANFGKGKPTWTVMGRTLPQFIFDEHIQNLRLIKIDTEGAEIFLIPSLKSWLMILNKKPAIWLSIHQFFWINVSEADRRALWEVISLFRFVINEKLQLIDNTPQNWATVDRGGTYLLSDELIQV